MSPDKVGAAGPRNAVEPPAPLETPTSGSCVGGFGGAGGDAPVG
ncbi:MAG: hypothetical protein ACRDLF_07700 [Solirubrobacteraceae bacterium]